MPHPTTTAHPFLLVGVLTTLSVSGCGSVTESSSHPTVTVTQFASPGAHPSEAGDSAAAPSGSARTAAAEVTATVDATTGTGSKGAVVVDAGSYAVEGGYAFSSPSGNLTCEITRSGAACVSRHSVVNLPGCGTNPNDPTSIAIVSIENHRVESGCTTDPEISQAGRTLGYDSQLNVEGVTCVSGTSGVRCTEQTSGASFSASRSYFGTTR